MGWEVPRRLRGQPAPRVRTVEGRLGGGRKLGGRLRRNTQKAQAQEHGCKRSAGAVESAGLWKNA